ncbi:MAG: type II secretion system F family protein [Anaerolineaceae bacterium]|nr:type II secretion system F family protein [Anaerolineaceae bacterium]
MNPLTIIFVIALGLSFLMLLVGILVSIKTNRDMANERLEQILSEKDYDDDLSESDLVLDEVNTPLVDWLDKNIEGTSWAEKTAKKLARADLAMKPGEYFAINFIAIVFFAAFFWFVGGQSIIGGLIGMIVGFILPGFYVKRAQKKRLEKFNDQLPDMLSFMVNGLRAGYSTMQAMEAVSREMPAPINDEFHRVVQEMQLGLSMEAALGNLLRRIPSDDLDLVITAINVQREVGGNLAEMLDIISYTIRERIRIKGEIKTLTTQTMYSGQFLSLLPVIVLAILFLLNREYMMQFFLPENNMPANPIPCGYCTLILAAVLIIIGYFTMRKLSDIEV